MSKKIIFLDLDGTALDDAKKLSRENKAALDEARAAGHRIVVTTGRPLESARIQAERHDLAGPGSYLIAYNGGQIYDIEHEKILFQQTISLKTVQAVFAEAARRDIHVQAYRNGKVLVDPRNDDREVRRYCDLIEMEYEVIPDISLLEEEPVKMHSSIFEDEKDLQGFGSWINETFPGELDSFLSAPIFLEIVSHGMNKGNALHMLAKLLDCPISETIAIGDEANDTPMIREAGIGAAMCNGIDEAKAAADYITEADNNHSGVAEVIRKFVL